MSNTGAFPENYRSGGINSADSFARDYTEARSKFLAAARAEKAAIDSVAYPERGPKGEELATDIAWLGPKNAEKVLVMISGTHGAEGFCGSGAQVDWLKRGEASRLGNIAVMMIHAINPYGFAWIRRVTHENVDLNRNWVDFSKPVPANPGYDSIAATIVPDRWTDETRAQTAETLQSFAAEQGPAKFGKAVSGGQYRHPKGIFYGGDKPSWSRQLQTKIYGDYLGQARRVAILDYHTGLGPWGFVEYITTHSPGEASYGKVKGWYGLSVCSTADGTSTSADIGGDGLTAVPDLLPGKEVIGMALEYGTLPREEVFLSLRADAWLHSKGDPLSPEGDAIRAQVRRAFYGDADDWKGMVAGQSLLTCRKALAGLAG